MTGRHQGRQKGGRKSYYRKKTFLEKGLLRICIFLCLESHSDLLLGVCLIV